VSTDEIYERYLKKAITEINELGAEITQAAGERHFPVVGSGHPLADIMLLKYGPQASEAQEGSRSTAAPARRSSSRSSGSTSTRSRSTGRTA